MWWLATVVCTSLGFAVFAFLPGLWRKLPGLVLVVVPQWVGGPGRRAGPHPATPAFQAVIEREITPGPAVQSAADIMDDIAQRASTVFHPVSTCRMGTDPRQAVVDAQLRVHGLQGLRVIDASVFPTLTSGNTNAPTLMLAEKGADLVLAATRTHAP